MTHSVWVGMDREVEKQLSLQVDLSLQRHRDFLIAHGLERCSSVIDIGTGSGRFLASIASEHPTIKFHGLDDKAHMLRAAAAFDLPNIDWTLADAFDARAAELLAAADGVLMRNIILHLPDTARSLQAILQPVRPGTRLWIFDVDLDHCSCTPSSEAFQQFLGMVRRFCEESGVASRTEALLPAILADNHFRVDRIVVEPFNNSHIERGRFAEYLLREASLYHYALYGTPGTRELSALRKLLFSKVEDPSPLVQYGMVMLAAERQPC